MNYSDLAILAVVLVFGTSSALLISRDWRLSIATLAVQYVGVAVLVAVNAPLEMALAKLVAGLMAGAVLAMAVLSLYQQGDETGVNPQTFTSSASTATPSGRLFRLLAVAIFGLAIWSISDQLMVWVPEFQWVQALGASILIGLGLLHLGLTNHAFSVVLGLLTVLPGFEILYSAVEVSALVAGLLAAVNLGLALIGAYMILAPTIAEAE